MPTYIVTGQMTISVNTEVEADSPEEALAKVRSEGRMCQSLCHHCAHGEPDREWVTSGELDGDPVPADGADDFNVEEISP